MLRGNGNDKLRELAARLYEVGDVGELAAPRVAARLRTLLAKQLEAGTSHLGTPWALTKPTHKSPSRKPELGRKATVTAKGSTVTYRLGGKSFLHHTGRARGKLTRGVIPVGVLSDEATAAVLAVLQTALAEALTGSKRSKL